MNKNLYDQFPHIVTEHIIIRKMVEGDLESLFEICSNDNVYRYTPTFLYTNSKKVLNTAIKNLGDRDFTKKKYIIAGICIPENPEKIIGTAEIFNYDKDINMVEIGYKINDKYWNKGIASKAVKVMVKYLFEDMGINRIQALVMPQNVASKKVLLKNGFTKEGLIRQANIWKGKGVVDLELFSLLRSDNK